MMLHFQTLLISMTLFATNLPTFCSNTTTTIAQCKTSFLGREYIGNVSETIQGDTCQRWDSQTSRTVSWRFPGTSLANAENYCRNPNSAPYGPWCYTTDGARWAYCDIPMCPPIIAQCKTSVLGREYIGNVSETIQGDTCQRWDSQTPHAHNRNVSSRFPDTSLANAENYCRNPDISPDGPWCYTTDGPRWGYCDIPLCPTFIVNGGWGIRNADMSNEKLLAHLGWSYCLTAMFYLLRQLF